MAGVIVLLIGLLLGLVAITQIHGTATVLKEGPCMNSSDAGRVCDELVVYHDGKNVVRAEMHGVNPGEVHGSPMHRSLAIAYFQGDTGPPTTDDMSVAIPIGLGLAGAVLLVLGLMMWRGKLGARRA